MFRQLATAVLCAGAMFAADLVFRQSLLLQVRPTIISPSDEAVSSLPIVLHWQGPERMRVFVSIAGESPTDLGIHESPFEMPRAQFPRDGGYLLEIQAERFSNWIRTQRWVQVHASAPPTEPPPKQEAAAEASGEAKDLLNALETARNARDRSEERSRALTEENATLREESDRLARQVEGLRQAQEDDAARLAELDRRLGQIEEDNRELAEESAALRQRLALVIPCTVWGYYSFTRIATAPITRRYLMVSDARGQIFRNQADCEFLRRGDPTASSICFCAGNSWGG